MPEHEHYREICAAASIGQATGVELAELNEHLTVCNDCRSRLADFMGIQASHYASRTEEPQMEVPEALGCIDSPLLRKRFMERAELEGIIFSRSGEVEEFEAVPSVRVGSTQRWSWFAVQSAGALLLVSAGIMFGRYELNSDRSRVYVSEKQPKTENVGPSTDLQVLIAKVSDLENKNQELTSGLKTARANYARASLHLAELQESTAKNDEIRTRLAIALQDSDKTVASLQQQLDQTKSAVADVRADLEKARAATTQNQTALVESRIRVQDLTEQLAEESKTLAREKEMLSAGRDIRELMAARNLHIVDVFDTDPKGKTRPAFGRIFLTEGKSLIFYAYDLSDVRVQDAGYHYRVWGKREGQNQRARSLGIFYSDDKSQKRWVFQYDDPKVLNEIDSVFVTLEPPNTNSSQPKGEKLLYAYLRGQANHP